MPHSLGEHEVLDAVRRHFPSARAEAAARVPRGDSSQVFALGARGQAKWIAKFYRAGDEPGTAAAVRSGVRVAERAGRSVGALRVPRVLRSRDGDVLASACGHLLQVQEHLPGVRVPLHEIGRDGLEQLGRVLALLHAAADEVPDRDHLLVPGAAVRSTLLRASERFPAAGFAAAAGAAEQLHGDAKAIIACTGAAAATVTVHGDVVADNLLVEGNTLALIDWDGVHRAPREYEFGTIALDAPGALAAVVQGYRRTYGGRLDGKLTLAHSARYLLFGLEFHIERALSGPATPGERRRDLGEARRYAHSCRNWGQVEAAVGAAMPDRAGRRTT